MKKSIITSAVVLVAITTLQAQINRPTVNVNRDQVNSAPLVQGLEVRNLDKMTIAEFNKLKVPIAQITTQKLNAKPTKSWKITPIRLNDGLLMFSSFYGYSTPKEWHVGEWNVSFPLRFKFRLQAGVEYRIKLKAKNEVKRNARISMCYSDTNEYICMGTRVDRNNEFNFVIMEPRSKNVKIEISGVRGEYTNRDEPFVTSQVIIDRIN